MVIKIEWDNKEETIYRADCLDCPGCPPIGRGETKEMAVANMFMRLLIENAGPANRPHSWLRYIQLKGIEIVDKTN